MICGFDGGWKQKKRKVSELPWETVVVGVKPTKSRTVAAEAEKLLFRERYCRMFLCLNSAISDCAPWVNNQLLRH